MRRELTADHYKNSPRAIHEGAKHADRVRASYREAFAERDRAGSAEARDAAAKKDTEAIAAAYGPGGSGAKVNPTEHADAQAEKARKAQASLLGVRQAYGQAVADLREAIAAHREEWEAQELEALVLAEARLEDVYREAQKVRDDLVYHGSRLAIARGGPTGLEEVPKLPESWSGTPVLTEALSRLSEALGFLGRDGVPGIAAPWEDDDEEAEVGVPA